MKKKPVRDVMIPLDQYPSVHVNSTLAEAIKVLNNDLTAETGYQLPWFQ